jgi:CheY-like chemotaxis protein/HPt (histidine-containing phosphotransfer) domain-containing protein
VLPLRKVVAHQIAGGDVDPPSSSLELKPVEASRPNISGPRQSVKLRGRILLVDDGETNRNLVGLMLRRCGAEVIEAENGEIGVQKATCEPFDLILMDMQMPVVDGYTATRYLRQQGLTIPIIALTANGMKGDEDACRAAGCSGYLAKPIDIDWLAEFVARMLPVQHPESAAECPSQTPCPAQQAPAPVRTSLVPVSDHDEFASIVAEFRERLSEKMIAMRSAWLSGDFAELARLVHWLKGTGGTVGFADLSRQAAALEKVVKQQSIDEIPVALAKLESIASQVTLQASTVG